MSSKKPFVAVLMGSDSDLPVMRITLEILKSFAVPTEVKITSAHRAPNATREYIIDAENRGCQVFIAAAGLAAHLAGMVAAHTCKPVIGVPLCAGNLQGMDALLSTTQMPGGIPVACMAIGNAGAKNAGLIAAQILPLNNDVLATRLNQYRQEMIDTMQTKDAALQQQLHLFDNNDEEAVTDIS